MTSISKQRLETLTDGVVAIIITLMVLDIKRPADGEIREVIRPIISYALSAIVIGIMWINHHNMFYLVAKSDTKLMWLNIHLLFWMSLIPLPTGSLGEHHLSVYDAQFYAIILAGNSLGYTMLNYHANHLMTETITSTAKRKFNITNLFSTGIYVIAFFAAYMCIFIAYALFIVVPVIYFSASLYRKAK